MIEPKEKTFGDIKVMLSPLPAMRGALVLHRLSKCFLPSISKAAGAFSVQGKAFTLATLQPDKLSSALETLFIDCTEKDLEYFIDTLVRPGIANNVPLDKTLDIAFQGKTLTLLQVLVWSVVEVHFADFFGDLPGLVARALALVESRTASASILKPDSQTLKK